MDSDPPDILARELPREVIAPVLAPLPVPAAPLPADAAPPAPAAATGVLPEGFTPCPLHAGRAVAGACTRCGAFYCEACREQVARANEGLCPTCNARSEHRDPVVAADALHRLVARWQLIGWALTVTWEVGALVVQGGDALFSAVATALAFAALLPLLGCALLVRTARWPSLLWVTAVLDFVYSFASLLLGASCMVSAGMLILGVQAGMAALKLSQLREATSEVP